MLSNIEDGDDNAESAKCDVDEAADGKADNDGHCGDDGVQWDDGGGGGGDGALQLDCGDDGVQWDDGGGGQWDDGGVQWDDDV